MARQRRRWWGRGFLVASALCAGAGLTLPWWWPVPAGWIAGLTIGDWETSGWSTVELRDVTYTREGVTVTAESVRVPAFVRWPRTANRPFAEGRGVVVTVVPVERAVPPPPPNAARIIGDILRAWPTVQQWVPSARVDGIEIVAPARTVHLSHVDWDGSRLDGSGPLPGGRGPIQISVTRPEAHVLHVELVQPAGDASAETSFRVVDERVDLSGGLEWRGNTAQIAGHWDAESLIPANATLEASDWELPAASVGLPGYGPVRGGGRMQWDGREFVANVTAAAEPESSEGSLPPLAIDLRARGDLARVQVDAAHVRLPGIDATLSAPLVVALPALTPAAPAEFTLAIDLGQVPRSPLTGTLQGRIAVNGGPGTAPTAEFSFAGEKLHWSRADASSPAAELASITVTGAWQPDELRLEKCDVQLAPDVGVHATATIDLARRELTASTLTADLTAAALRPWWPAVPAFARATIEGQAAGPLAAPKHAGKLGWTALAGVPGGALDGQLQWEGEGITAVTAEGSVHSAAGVTLPLAAHIARADDGAFAAELTQLAWQDGTGEWWHLAQPARVHGAGGAWTIEQLELIGDDTNLTLDASVQWPGSGRVTLGAQHVDGVRLQAFLPERAGMVQLDAIDLEASWDHGPVIAQGSLRATLEPNPATRFSVEAEFSTAAGDFALGALRVLDASGVVLEGDGRVAFALSGNDDGFTVSLPPDGAIALRLVSTPNPPFWTSISELTKWGIAAPAVQAELSGTWQAPRGQVEFATSAVQPPDGLAGAAALPRIGDVKFVVAADDAGIGLTQGIFTLDGNWVSLKGSVPWALWRETLARRTFSWRDAAFSFAADRMPMAIASGALPLVLAPDGNVSFELKHEPGQGLTGFLWLADAGLRPFPPLGSVRDIGGRVELEGYRARVPQLSAYVGGRPIEITGTADIATLDQPVFDLHLESARVPLVREQGLVLRAGLDVRIEQTRERPAHISGAVQLEQSVFVSDLVSLLPTGGSVATPEQRPPYFSVRNPPMSAWTLDVTVRGEDFLRIENPFVKGTISADLQLTGTLAEPRVIGRAWAERGSIIFPFGSLRVEQMEVSLTPENPFQPALMATASSRLYGYDVRLEVSGTAAEPRLLFSSDPPLTSQQVFLLLTTGAMPDSENSFSSSERAQRIALFVGRNLANSLGLGAGSGDTDKLEIRSGEDFSREGGETLLVQYNLDDRWSIVAEKDRFDAYNGGIKFRIIDR